jgi:hypothetical protein
VDSIVNKNKNKNKNKRRIVNILARRQRVGQGWRGTNMLCRPTWDLSTSLEARVVDASYVYLEDILFSSKVFEDTYAERCIKDRVLLENNVARVRMKCAEKRATKYHKSCVNPWLVGKKRTRNNSFERPNVRDKILQEVYDILDLSNCNDFAPHFGQEWVSSVDAILTSLSSYAGEKMTDEVISHVEGLVALLVALQGTTDFMSAGAVCCCTSENFLTGL